MIEYDETIFQASAETTSTPKTDSRDPLQKAAAFFHKPIEGAEPDWQGLLLNAQNMTEKFKIRAARDAWKAEQKIKAHQQAQAAMDARIDEAIKASVFRNKAYYDRLQREDGSVYWSVPVQRQMKTDKSALGLSWYSKK